MQTGTEVGLADPALGYPEPFMVGPEDRVMAYYEAAKADGYDYRVVERETGPWRERKTGPANGARPSSLADVAEATVRAHQYVWGSVLGKEPESCLCGEWTGVVIGEPKPEDYTPHARHVADALASALAPHIARKAAEAANQAVAYQPMLKPLTFAGTWRCE